MGCSVGVIAVVTNRIITGIFGVDPSLALSSPPYPDAADEPSQWLRDAGTARGFEGKLEGLRIRGRLYTVTSTAVGLSIRQQ